MLILLPDGRNYMLVNLETVTKQLNNLSNELADKFVYRCGLQVERKAKDLCPKDTGTLANSIKTEMIGPGEASVGTNVGYAVFVHEGTGIYAKDGVITSRPRGSYWIYIKKPNGQYDTYKEGNPGQSKTYNSLAEAKRAWYYLHEVLGLDAHITNGQAAQPFLTNALYEEEPNFDAILKEIMKEAL